MCLLSAGNGLVAGVHLFFVIVLPGLGRAGGEIPN